MFTAISIDIRADESLQTNALTQTNLKFDASMMILLPETSQILE